MSPLPPCVGNITEKMKTKKRHKKGDIIPLTTPAEAARAPPDAVQASCSILARVELFQGGSVVFEDVYGSGGSLFLIKVVNRSSGTGKNVVVLCSLAISRIVCRKRSCNAIGSLLIIAAACTIFSAA